MHVITLKHIFIFTTRKESIQVWVIIRQSRFMVKTTKMKAKGGGGARAASTALQAAPSAPLKPR